MPGKFTYETDLPLLVGQIRLTLTNYQFENHNFG